MCIAQESEETKTYVKGESVEVTEIFTCVNGWERNMYRRITSLIIETMGVPL